MKIPAAICTSLILAAAQPFATAQGGAAPPTTPPPVGIGAGGPPPIILGGAPPSTTPPIGIGAGGPPAAIPGGGAPLPPTAPPAGIGAGGPPTSIIQSAPLPPPTPGGGSLEASGLPVPVPVIPLPPPPIVPPPPLKVAPRGALVPGAMTAPIAGGAPVAANPGTGFSTFVAPSSAAPSAMPGMPGNAGNYPKAAPSAMPALPPGQPGYHNHASNFFYDAVPSSSAAPSPRTGQEIIRAAKLRVLERHYEETLNQMIQLEKDALTASPEERAKMEASAQAMRAFLSKLETELLPLAEPPKETLGAPGIPGGSGSSDDKPAATATPEAAPHPAINKLERAQNNFLGLFFIAQKADELVSGGQFDKALELYHQVESALLTLQKEDPKYQPEIVAWRLKRTRESMNRLEAQKPATPGTTPPPRSALDPTSSAGQAENESTPKGPRNRVLAVNSKWGFAVVSLSAKEGAAVNRILVVNRGGRSIGRLKIASVKADLSTADIVPNTFANGFSVQPGDDVTFVDEEKTKVEAGSGAIEPPALPSFPDGGAPALSERLDRLNPGRVRVAEKLERVGM